VKRKYLGDSYDAVKRLWQQVFSELAPLFAEPQFVPEEIQSEFTLLTQIPLLTTPRPRVFSIFNDPDTGIRLPGRDQTEGRTHVSLSTIFQQLTNSAVRCVITYDQSDYRDSGLNLSAQRDAKMQWLAGKRVASFYYVSHAPFLFAFPIAAVMNEAKLLLRKTGIPATRLQELTSDA
jgi:hypothetical protein